MNSKLNHKERDYLARVKELPCGVCEKPPISEAHHIEQGQTYICIPLCKDCHTNPKLGIHGEKTAWKIRKLTEMDVLNETIRKLVWPA